MPLITAKHERTLLLETYASATFDTLIFLRSNLIFNIEICLFIFSVVVLLPKSDVDGDIFIPCAAA